jgi:hypothetical protein
MTEVENYIHQFEGQQHKVLLYLHRLLTNEFNLTEKIKFKIPFYYGRTWICFLNATKNNKVELAFTRGNELSNEQGILESKGRKQVYGLEFEKVADIPVPLIHEILHEAILLDQSKPYRHPKHSKQ